MSNKARAIPSRKFQYAQTLTLDPTLFEQDIFMHARTHTHQIH